MSEILDKAVEALKARIGEGFDGSVKFEIEGIGAVMVDGNGVRVADEPADCTLKADADTFQAMLSGDLNPTTAFMTGKLSVDGDMGAAMRLGSLLA